MAHKDSVALSGLWGLDPAYEHYLNTRYNLAGYGVTVPDYYKSNKTLDDHLGITHCFKVFIEKEKEQIIELCNMAAGINPLLEGPRISSGIRKDEIKSEDNSDLELAMMDDLFATAEETKKSFWQKIREFFRRTNEQN